MKAELADIRARLDELAGRVQVDAAAGAFLDGDRVVRNGDYAVIDGFPTQVWINDHDGTLSYQDRRGLWGTLTTQPSGDIQRLYTMPEVEQIVARALAAASSAITTRAGDAPEQVELGRWQHPTTKGWWRLVRDLKPSTAIHVVVDPCHLESISERSLERGLSWAYACTISISRSEHVSPARVRAESEAYLALRDKVTV